MPQGMPSWFAADNIFRGTEGWYIGSPRSFKVGPYQHQTEAEARSREITSQLKHCADIGSMVRTVRAFLNSQSEAVEIPAPAVAAESAVKRPAHGVVGSVKVPPLRAGEDAAVWFRTSRYFAVDDAWFFATRENIDVGPYASKAAAEQDAKRLVELLNATESESERLRAIHQFKTRPTMNRRH
jgi:hypothetical protein